MSSSLSRPPGPTSSSPILKRVSQRPRPVPWKLNVVFTSVADPDPYVFGPPGPDPLVRGKDPDPSIISKKNLDSYCFVTSF
jgi:hypothetical protein